MVDDGSPQRESRTAAPQGPAARRTGSRPEDGVGEQSERDPHLGGLGTTGESPTIALPASKHSHLNPSRPWWMETYHRSNFAYALRVLEPLGLLAALAGLVLAGALLYVQLKQQRFIAYLRLQNIALETSISNTPLADSSATSILSPEQESPTPSNRPRTGVRQALERAIRLGINTRGMDLRGALLTRADLENANLGDVILVDAILGGATLTGVTLEGADLTNAHLTNAHLTFANLRGATLTDANLGGATLTGANLDGTILAGANVSGVNMLNVHGLTQAQLDSACGNRSPTDLPAGLTWQSGSCTNIP